MVKNFKNLLRNQKADDLKSWYTALGAQVCSNDDPELTLTFSMARSNWVS